MAEYLLFKSYVLRLCSSCSCSAESPVCCTSMGSYEVSFRGQLTSLQIRDHLCLTITGRCQPRGNGPSTIQVIFSNRRYSPKNRAISYFVSNRDDERNRSSPLRMNDSIYYSRSPLVQARQIRSRLGSSCQPMGFEL